MTKYTETAPPVNKPFFAYMRPNDRSVMEQIGPHQTANSRTAAILRRLPALRETQEAA
jgi:hypothetical protein